MKKVYLIGNAHLDPVWLWKKGEGLSEILSTFRSALDRMTEFPDYIFTSACAHYYQWVEQVDPRMFHEIQERVKEGRWSVTGGFWVQPDCNIPSGEAFVRHALYSQRYFKEKFGLIATVGYNVDSFGHNGMLPQLLKKSGMDHYVFMRPDDWENPNLPNLFQWESPDGSQVTTHKINCGYADSWGCPEGVEPCGEKIKVLRKKAEDSHIPYMDFYGIGNHGGGPTIRGLQALEQAVAAADDVGFSSTQEYFKDVEASGIAASLPVVKSGLQHHASGCYAANAAVKEANRRAENALVKAEKYDLLAQRLLSVNSLQDGLKPAWEKVLFNQFHDILAGCSIREAYDDAMIAFSGARDTAAEITATALHRIAWNIHTTKGLDCSPCQKNAWILWEKDGEGAPVVVFNPHSFPIREVMQINTTVAGVSDSDGTPLPCQNVRGPQTNGDDRTNTIFLAEVPAYGYSVYYVYREHSFSPPAPPEVHAEGCVLENRFLRVSFDSHTGCISSLYDKEADRELAAAPMAKAVVIDDYASDTWAHRRFIFEDEIGVFTDASIRILENGPIRAAIRITSRYQNSILQQDFRLTPYSKELEVCCKLDFHEQLKLVKLCFPVRVEDPLVTYSAPYGFEDNQPDGIEEPSHEWMRIASCSTPGLSLCNDSKYSFSAKRCEQGAEMRMTLARGTIFADHFGQRDDLVEYQDQGELFFRYTLVSDADTAFVVRRAAVLNMPPELLMETHHTGSLSPSYEGIRISAENVALTAAKFAEDGDGYILRLVETAGKKTSAEIDAAFLGIRFQISINPQEIKTFRVIPESYTITEVLLTEM